MARSPHQCLPARALLVGIGLTGLMLAVGATVAIGATGALTQKSGTAACVSETGAGPCTDGAALGSAASVAVAPDGDSVYVASGVGDAVVAMGRDATGALTQPPGADGCVSETGTSGACADGVALNGASSVAVSPDGSNVYVASVVSDAVTTFDRNTATGALTQKPGTDGCISESGTGGLCEDGQGLNGAQGVSVSPDGESVYVASLDGDAVAIFDRDTATGELTQKADAEGCVANSAGVCTGGVALAGAFSVTVSPDSDNVYVASFDSDALAVFERNTATGALTQLPGTDACVSETGAGPCADGVALDGVTSVTISPDGASVYSASQVSGAVSIFDRQAAAGELAQKPGTDGCISNTGTAGLCAQGAALSGSFSVATSPDGKSAYAASILSDAVVALDRDTATGKLTQKPGTDGCVSDDGTSGGCANGTALAGADSVAVSPDAAGVYVAAATSDAVAVFDRDAIPPQTTITSGPSGPTRDSTPSFAFVADEPGSSFECRTDSGAFAACTSPAVIGPLADGVHGFAVRATDPAHDTGPAAERTFTIDTKLTRPRIKTKGTQRQRGGAIVIKLSAGAGERVTVEARGKVKTGGESFALRPTSKNVGAEKRKTLKLAPKRHGQEEQIAAALAAGDRARAKLSIDLSDRLGNSVTRKLAVRLK